MPNKSHFNSGHMMMNKQRRDGEAHSSSVDFAIPKRSRIFHSVDDCRKLLKKIPDESVQLIVVDPPYNLELADWDIYGNYVNWAKEWLEDCYRVLDPKGNLVIFGGLQYQGEKSGDLLELLHFMRHNTNFSLVNMIIWHYPNGMGAHRFFANRHEEIAWFSKTKKYYFDLDSVRVKLDEKTLAAYLKDKRLNPENVRKGKNPTNVWDIGRLNGNSKERVGHETQKPVALIRRIIKSMSYPGALVLDFFAGSGTTGRVCIEEKRNCIMCDSDPKTLEYFAKHIENMDASGIDTQYDQESCLQRMFVLPSTPSSDTR